MTPTLFETLAKKFESLHSELQDAHDPVLNGLILVQMRNTLDAMWVEHRKSPATPTANLDEKERLLKEIV